MVAQNGSDGSGNAAVQCYTDDPANASRDGRGNLVIQGPPERGYSDLSASFWRLALLSSTAVSKLAPSCLQELAFGRRSGILGSDIDAVGWPACGEIDVMESLDEPHRVFGTVRCPAPSMKAASAGIMSLVGRFPARTRLFAVDWRPRAIIVDVESAAVSFGLARELGSSWVFDHPFYILLNLAVGDLLGGAVNDKTQIPAEFVIDYLRVYEHRS